MSTPIEHLYTETYDEWRERVGIMPDQDVREAWEYQQEKINELLAIIGKMTKIQEKMTREQRKLWEDR